MADHADIDTEMYLRDGMPYACVCKVQLRDGRIGVGIFCQDPKQSGSLDGPAANRAALDDALENVPDPVPTMTVTRQHHEHLEFDGDVDLQASLGQKAHE